jgi:(S)-ureidoglycine aminohydrolase
VGRGPLLEERSSRLRNDLTMPSNQLPQSRARVRDRYALMPTDGFPPSRLPRWRDTEARILAAPALGADFVQMLLTVQPGGGVHQPGDDRTQTFLYVLSGGVEVTIESHRVIVAAGGFAYVPHAADYEVRAPVASSMLLLRKRYEPVSGVAKPEAITGNQANVPAEPWMGNEHTRLQTLLPEDCSYDFAMNIFAFDAGHGLPFVETHVMEHGLYFLEGEGTYYLGEDSYAVQPNDFIWMAPFCPQGFIATGSTPSRYLYYKNVNRDIALERRVAL